MTRYIGFVGQGDNITRRQLALRRQRPEARRCGPHIGAQRPLRAQLRDFTRSNQVGQDPVGYYLYTVWLFHRHLTDMFLTHLTPVLPTSGRTVSRGCSIQSHPLRV